MRVSKSIAKSGCELVRTGLANDKHLGTPSVGARESARGWKERARVNRGRHAPPDDALARRRRDLDADAARVGLGALGGAVGVLVARLVVELCGCDRV